MISFFGFALKKARESDFGLGYRNTRAWWEGFLGCYYKIALPLGLRAIVEDQAMLQGRLVHELGLSQMHDPRKLRTCPTGTCAMSKGLASSDAAPADDADPSVANGSDNSVRHTKRA